MVLMASTGIERADKTISPAYVGISENAHPVIAPLAEHLQAAVFAKAHSSARTMIPPALLPSFASHVHQVTVQANIPLRWAPAGVS